MCEIIKLNPNDQLYKTICANFPEKEFSREFTIINKGQRPNVGILVLSGQLMVEKDNTSQTVGPENLVGIKELLSGKSINVTVTIGPKSIVTLIDKFLLKDLVDKNQELFKEIL